MNRFHIYIICFVLAAVSIGCGTGESGKTEVASTLDSLELPDSELGTATIRLHNRDRVTTEIDAETIRKYEKLDSTMAYVVSINIYDSAGRATTNIVGDSGIIREASQRIDMFGSVVVITDDSIQLNTEYLYWLGHDAKIHSTEFVKITVGDDVMSGIGLEADQDLFPFRILDQVSGKITDVKQRGKEL
ncbi:MAG: LPS export ABC transporter periplasmic protein LptC [bacterium]|nr:LPS export ABC transporter periplasmic protein LptC [bacterium]